MEVHGVVTFKPSLSKPSLARIVFPTHHPKVLRLQSDLHRTSVEDTSKYSVVKRARNEGYFPLRLRLSASSPYELSFTPTLSPCPEPPNGLSKHTLWHPLYTAYLGSGLLPASRHRSFPTWGLLSYLFSRLPFRVDGKFAGSVETFPFTPDTLRTPAIFGC